MEMDVMVWSAPTIAFCNFLLREIPPDSSFKGSENRPIIAVTAHSPRRGSEKKPSKTIRGFFVLPPRKRETERLHHSMINRLYAK